MSEVEQLQQQVKKLETELKISYTVSDAYLEWARNLTRRVARLSRAMDLCEKLSA